jgi:aspartate kinase
MIVMKFGGSSLANAERIRHVGKIVETHLDENPVLVLSAIGKTTDDLIEAGNLALTGRVDLKKISDTHQAILTELKLLNTGVEELLEELFSLLKGISLIKELTPKTMDYLLSFGERISIRLFSAYLCQQGIKAEPLDGWSVGFITSSHFTRAEILPETYENIARRLKSLDKCIPVVTGFIAKDSNGAITTLGRGGSDLTAAVIGAALGVREIQVWKDVHGILSTDPRILETAFPIPSLSFEEAAELAYFGAKVLHPTSILPAMKKGIPVRVKNSYDPTHPGTLIISNSTHQNGLLTAITYKPSQVLVHICSTRMLGQYGFLAKVFQIFADLKISVDVIATSEVSISLTLENQEGLAELERRLGEIATIRMQQFKTIVSLIGNAKRSSQILERAVKTLSQEGIEVQMISHGASNVNTSLVVNDAQAKKSIHLLHEHFFRERRII